jgi:hypothetical protein
MAFLSLSLPSFDRWERPSTSVRNALSEYPGRFLHGPDENWGLFGFFNGGVFVLLLPSLHPVALGEAEEEDFTALDTFGSENSLSLI